MQRFPDQKACIEHLEKVRWNGKPKCPHCNSEKVHKRKCETKISRIGIWDCASCDKTFKVTHNTLFHGTKIPLQKWFLAISLMLNAKKGISSYQLARDLELNQKTAWRMETCIRAEMTKETNKLTLQGIIEADETYIGGKPRKANKKVDREPNKRGRGTNKTPVIGVIARGGKVVAEVATKLTGRAIRDFIKRNVNTKDSELITDEFKAYTIMGKEMKHRIIHHKEQYVDGDIHTNTIEGFWSLLKRAWYGTHHHYKITYTPLYVGEACYKYNYRNHDNLFEKFIKECILIE